jgi:TolB-like protein
MSPSSAMLRLTSRLPRRVLGVAALIAAGACAGAPAPQSPAPADIPALEARRAQSPDDPAANLRLAEAYYSAQRYGDARAALARTLLHESGNAEAQIYLGYTYEGLGQFDSARTVYTRLEASKPSGPVRRLLNGRLALVAQHQLVYDARAALARESTLSKTPPPPNTVAVMPFRYTGTDSTYQPLSRGLAALVVTDLSRVHSLRLLERERVQVLLDEMKLSESGRVDPATGARSGHLIGASQVVQGQFDVQPNQVRVNATVVRTSDAGVAATGTGSDRLQALFDVEKQVVFQLLGKMGITLTPAEQTAISERPTRDIEAFLLYSRGLAAQDQGNFSVATQAFSAAAAKDPGFTAASSAAASSQQASDASGTTASDATASIVGPPTPPAPPLGQTLTTSINNTVGSGATGILPTGGGTGGTQGGTPGGIPPTRPAGVCEVVAVCGPSNTGLFGTLIIIITRP